MRLPLPLGSLALLVPMFACSVEATSDRFEEQETELYAASSTLRPAARNVRKTTVSVCFRNPTGFTKEIGWVRDILKSTWSTAADIEFKGFGSCGSADVPITVDDIRPTWSGGLGTRGDGMTLNFTYRNFATDCARTETDRKRCIEAHAIHEFGHALGLAHEANRPDSPCDDTQGSSGDVYWAYDANSVMNYCASRRNTLSALDRAGIAKLYGGPGATTQSGKRYAMWNEGNRKYFHLFSNVHGDQLQFSDKVKAFTIERASGGGTVTYGDKIALRNGSKYIYPTGDAKTGAVSLWTGTVSFKEWQVEDTADGNNGTTLDIREPFRVYWTFKGKKHYLTTLQDPHSSDYMEQIHLGSITSLGSEWRFLGDFDM